MKLKDFLVDEHPKQHVIIEDNSYSVTRVFDLDLLMESPGNIVCSGTRVMFSKLLAKVAKGSKLAILDKDRTDNGESGSIVSTEADFFKILKNMFEANTKSIKTSLTKLVKHGGEYKDLVFPNGLEIKIDELKHNCLLVKALMQVTNSEFGEVKADQFGHLPKVV